MFTFFCSDLLSDYCYRIILHVAITTPICVLDNMIEEPETELLISDKVVS